MDFENIQNAQENQDQPTAEVSEQMKTIDAMTNDQDAAVVSTIEDFKDGNTIKIPREKRGIMQNLTEQVKKNKLVKAAAFALTLSAAAPAFSQDVGKSIDLEPNNGTLTTTLRAIESGKKAAIDSQEHLRENDDSYITKSGRIVLKEPSSERERIFDGLKTVTFNGRINGLTQGQLMQDTLNNMPTPKKYLPGVTINGGPAYEIAPGVYGNEHSIHTDGVSVGTVTIE